MTLGHATNSAQRRLSRNTNLLRSWTASVRLYGRILIQFWTTQRATVLKSRTRLARKTSCSCMRSQHMQAHILASQGATGILILPAWQCSSRRSLLERKGTPTDMAQVQQYLKAKYYLPARVFQLQFCTKGQDKPQSPSPIWALDGKVCSPQEDHGRPKKRRR